MRRPGTRGKSETMRRDIFRLLIASSLGASLAGSAAEAWAEDPISQCIAASDKGLDLRKERKLIDARKAFVACATAACGVEIKETCEKHIVEINSALPTLILVPKDNAGNDIGGVKAWVDGAPLAESLDGRPLALDPGKHTFKLESQGQPPVERTFVLNESEKDRREQITIGLTAAPPAEKPPLLPPPGEVPARSGNPQRSIGYAVGGAGIVGVAIGSIFGLQAIAKNNTANCDANSYCQDPQSRRDAQGSATISTAGFVAGGVLLAGGLVLILTAPMQHNVVALNRSLEVAPMVGGASSGLVLRGTW